MISVIIPTYNEEICISRTIAWLREKASEGHISEILVCDGGSTDQTVVKASLAGAEVLLSPRKGRSAQMNYGALHAKGKILYFLHADTLPPESFSTDILAAISSGRTAGCFTLSFDRAHWFLKANCWFTRFDFNYFRFGDQSLFISKNLFLAIGGFCEKHIVMEDQEIVKRIKAKTGFQVIPKPVLTSARKYLDNGIYKTQGIFFLIFFMYRAGYSQERLLNTYRKLIRQDKV